MENSLHEALRRQVAYYWHPRDTKIRSSD